MAKFSDESSQLEQSWYMVTKVTVLQNYIEISLGVSDIYIHTPFAAMFLINYYSLKNMEYYYKVTTEIFLPNYIEIGPAVSDNEIFLTMSILYRYIDKISPTPLAAIFFYKSPQLE